MKLIFLQLSVLVLFATLSVTTVAQQTNPNRDIPLNNETYAAWRDHILPTQDEQKFLSIPWERSFGEGIIRGDETDKPVLLWAMNGHPLGCT